MSKIIIYPKNGNKGAISILFPTPQWQGSLEELALKDLPRNSLYSILDKESLPSEVEHIDAWEADFTKKKVTVTVNSTKKAEIEQRKKEQENQLIVKTESGKRLALSIKEDGALTAEELSV